MIAEDKNNMRVITLGVVNIIYIFSIGFEEA